MLRMNICVQKHLRTATLWLQTSQEVAGSIPYIVLAQFRLELTRAQLPVPCLQQMLISCPLWQGRLVTVQ